MYLLEVLCLAISCSILVLLGFCKLHRHVNQTSRERGPTLACAFALDVKSFPEDNLSTLQYAAQVLLGDSIQVVVLSKNFSHTCEMTTLEYDS